MQFDFIERSGRTIQKKSHRMSQEDPKLSFAINVFTIFYFFEMLEASWSFSGYFGISADLKYSNNFEFIGYKKFKIVCFWVEIFDSKVWRPTLDRRQSFHEMPCGH